MAARIEPDAILPISTGQVVTPGPVTVEQPADATSTGAVPGPTETISSEFGPTGPVSTGTVDTPGPVTTRSSWAKVIRAQQRAETRTGTPAETRQTDQLTTGQVRAQRGQDDSADGR